VGRTPHKARGAQLSGERTNLSLFSPRAGEHEERIVVTFRVLERYWPAPSECPIPMGHPNSGCTTARRGESNGDGRALLGRHHAIIGSLHVLL
jgi:hypothetical protein